MRPIQERLVLVIKSPEKTTGVLGRIVQPGCDDIGDHAQGFDGQAAGQAEGERLPGLPGWEDCEFDRLHFGTGAFDVVGGGFVEVDSLG